MTQVRARVQAEDRLLRTTSYTHPLTKKALESRRLGREYSKCVAMYHWLTLNANEASSVDSTTFEQDHNSEEMLSKDLHDAKRTGDLFATSLWPGIKQRMREYRHDDRKLLTFYRHRDDFLRLQVKEHKHGPQRDRLRLLYLRNASPQFAMDWSTRSYSTLTSEKTKRDVTTSRDHLIPPSSSPGLEDSYERRCTTRTVGPLHNLESDIVIDFTHAIWTLTELRRHHKRKPGIADDIRQYARMHYNYLTSDAYNLAKIAVKLLESPPSKRRDRGHDMNDVWVNPYIWEDPATRWTRPAAARAIADEHLIPCLRGGGDQKFFSKLTSRIRGKRCGSLRRMWQRVGPSAFVASEARPEISIEASVAPGEDARRRRSALCWVRDRVSRRRSGVPNHEPSQNLRPKTSSFREELHLDGPVEYAKREGVVPDVLIPKLNALIETHGTQTSSSTGSSRAHT